MRRDLATFGLCFFAGLMTSPGVAASESQPAAVRPVPEYARTQSVILSEDLFNYKYHAAELVEAIAAAGADVLIATPAPRKAAAFKALLKSWGVRAGTQARVSALHLPHDNIWLRDYAPVPLASASATGPRLGLADLRYDDAASINDALPQALGKLLKLPVVPVPAFVDGGNFLVAGDLCLTTTAGSLTTEVQPGPLALQKQYGKTMGCRQVIVLQDPPHVHLDMWAKVVDDRRILVNQIDDETMALARELGSDFPASELKTSLDRMAQELSQHLEVVRIPMPLPYRGTFRTYTNSLLINGDAIVPLYRRFGWDYDDYPDAKLTAGYERKVIGIYERLGFRVRLINADGMIYNGGAFHCVTAALPRLDSPAKGP